MKQLKEDFVTTKTWWPDVYEIVARYITRFSVIPLRSPVVVL